MPQTPNGWWYEIVDQTRKGGVATHGTITGGKVWTEIQVWRSLADRDNGLPPFILNNFKSQIRTEHTALVKFGTAYRHVATGQLVDVAPSRGQGTLPAGVMDYSVWERLPSNVFVPFPWFTYDGRPETLDAQFERETYTLSVEEQVTPCIERFIERADRLGWSGDLRGSTENLIVAASADDYRVSDDGSGYTGTTSGASSKLNCSSTSSTRYDLAFRFLSVDIQQASTINSVTWTINCDSTLRDDFDGTFWFEAADNAAAFSDTTSRHALSSGSGMSFTTGTGNFTNLSTGTGDVSTGWPSLVSNCQEVINRAGFVSGNAVAVAVTSDTAPDSRDGTMQSYDGSTSLCARMDIDYTAPAGGDPEGGLVGGKLIRGGLLRGGVLVR